MRSYLDVKDGDLLVWREDHANWLSSVFLKTVRFFTVSDFAHVGVAIWLSGQLHVIEATQPRIRASLVVDSPYHIPMPGAWTEPASSFLLAQVGTEYSFADCLRAYLGITTRRDDNWQCAELTHEFYRVAGIDLGNAKTPSKLVRAALQRASSDMALIAPATGVQ